MTATLRVAALVGSRTDPDRLIGSVFGDESLEHVLSRASGRPVNVEFVTWIQSTARSRDTVIGTDDQLSPFDRTLIRLGAPRLSAFLQRYPIGRLLDSLGPLDQSRVFWRTVRGNSKAMAALQSAEVVIAVDLPAVRTAWEIRRRNPRTEAFYGLTAVSKIFASRFPQTSSS